jgi:hypothetical protein
MTKTLDEINVAHGLVSSRHPLFDKNYSALLHATEQKQSEQKSF